MKPGPSPTCTCGECHLCRARTSRQKYYRNHPAMVIRKNVARKRTRRQVAANVSDEELDRRALVLMGRQQSGQ